MIKGFSVENLISKALQFRKTTVGIILGLIALGIWAFQTLPMEAYPDFTNPLVRIITIFPGKGAEEIERLITIPLEKELNGIPGETNLRSVSLFGLSVVYVTFQDGTPSFNSRQQVIERLNLADLPDGVKPELDPDASPVGEIYRYTLDSRYFNPMTLKALQDWKMEKVFRQIPGVIDVTSFGGPSKTYQVNIDPDRLKAYDLTITQVFKAIQNANGTTGGNYIENNGQAYIVRGLGLIKGAPDLENVVIDSQASGTPIRVRDVATISVGAGVRLGQVGKNLQDDVIEGIVLMRRGESPAKVVQGLYERLPEIQATLPKGIHLVPLYDRLELVRRTLDTIGHNIAEGIVLVVAVLLLFMFDVRSALVAATVIPLSLLFAFLMLNVFQIPANLLSLGAVDFGIIVDGTVVMVEHIHGRLVHDGEFMTPFQRIALILKAATEVGTPILFSTAIIATAFLPIFAFDGVAGKLFRPLAFTMNFALLGAVLMTVTAIPLFCWFFMAQKPLPHRDSPILVAAEKLYRPLLGLSLKASGPLMAITLIVVLASGWLFTTIGTEFLPSLDEGNIWLRVTVLPTSVSLERSVQIARQVRTRLMHYPEVKNVVSQIGSPDNGTDPNNPSNVEFLVDLKLAKDWRPQWHEEKQRLVAAMDKELEEIPGILTTFSQYIQDNVDEAIAGAKGQVVVKIFGPDLPTLQKIGQKAAGLFGGVPGMVDIAADTLVGQPQYQITVNRAKANRYGINVGDVEQIIETAIAGKTATQLIEGEQRFDVKVRFDKPYRSTVTALQNILIPTPSGANIPLEEVAELSTNSGASAIMRADNSRMITVKANVRGRDLGNVVRDAQTLMNQHVTLPAGYRAVWGGQFENQQRANARLTVAIPITMVAIFLLLLIMFRSKRLALLGMAPIPLAIIGAAIGLWVTGTYFSVSAGVGFIAAMGVSVQNGVVMLSRMVQLSGKGVPAIEAAGRGALEKLRPVLMAGIVAILGLIPAAISNGIGSQSQKPFAIVIIAALLSATSLTLIVLPALYAMICKPQPGDPPPETPSNPDLWKTPNYDQDAYLLAEAPIL